MAALLPARQRDTEDVPSAIGQRLHSKLPILLLNSNEAGADPPGNVAHAQRELPNSRTVIFPPPAGHGQLGLPCAQKLIAELRRPSNCDWTRHLLRRHRRTTAVRNGGLNVHVRRQQERTGRRSPRLRREGFESRPVWVAIGDAVACKSALVGVEDKTWSRTALRYRHRGSRDRPKRARASALCHGKECRGRPTVKSASHSAGTKSRRPHRGVAQGRSAGR